MPQTYGAHLPDQVDRISALSDAQIDLLADIRDIYTQRVALEREYAAKLQALSRKAAERKNRKIAALVVGDDPTKAWDSSTIRQSTLERAYAQLLMSMEESAADHINLADGLQIKVAEALKVEERRHEELKKKQILFFTKLLGEREKTYLVRIKSKQKYDEECEEVETYRQKQERASDDKHADRAARQYEQQQNDMNIAKNVYLVAIDVANKAKRKFYDEDLPAVENQFQTLQTQLVTGLTLILGRAQLLHHTHSAALESRAKTFQEVLSAVNPAQDQDLFIDYNIRPFTAPGDWAFEPCSTHYDTGGINLDPSPKVFLQNKLSRSRAKLEELMPVVEAKRREIALHEKRIEAHKEKVSPEELARDWDAYFEAQHELALLTHSECVLRTEIETISAALGGDEGSNQPHAFKASSFSIPTQCAYCKSSIWGLSKQGKTCKACGISVHTKCELKVPAACGLASGTHAGGQLHHSASTATARTSTSSRSSPRSSIDTTPTPSSFLHSESASTIQESHPRAKVQFDFTASSPFELSVAEGTDVEVLEEDDGSGWVKVDDRRGGKGLVPASYVEYVDGAVSGLPPTGPGDQAEYVRAIYDYAAQGGDEIGFREGETIRLSDGPSGGRNYADGWWEGFDSAGKKGIFPSNYVQPV
ncbi:hypothetical protein PUNSTDRAFT_97060 [Punctularia strigosozonata HHB-11173 SS5]|uniref:uncharacterized protein n=1 Tax=Punctularia strigosozonata (strain HHB-11173) TaxID=741275 RepID=UPI0004417690|nr:uncharacterized protein PUNSTDRAFT_97060 [Punctularia strigosozonata HHB-11173 SS5]EIN12379.1 hypothetical protein PUNSTDRAFT_97060 [Punctularia strigosozonata HHB-11173 SS5]